MTTLTPHQETILAVLARGPIEDRDGLATTILARSTGHRTTNALSGVLQGMEERGWLTREISGRRTFRIALTPSGAAALAPHAEAELAASQPGAPAREVESLRVEIATLRARVARQDEVIANLSAALAR